MMSMVMQKVLRRMALLGVSSVFLFGLVACGDGGATQAECKEPAAAFPERLKGELELDFKGISIIPVPVDLRVERDASDHCVLQMVSTQSGSPMCGTVFSGTVHYNPEDDEWEGVLETSGDEPLTVMEVRYSHRRVDNRVKVWNYLTAASDDEQCGDLEVTGYARP